MPVRGDVKAHIGRRSITKGKSSKEVEDILKGREEANKKNAESVAKYMTKRVKTKIDEKWKKQSEGISRGDIYNDI